MVVYRASLFHFGVISSRMHALWLGVVGGRLKSDYRYSSVVVYNNFVWPNVDDDLRCDIEACAQAVIDVRAAHAPVSLGTLYDPESMPVDLLAAHRALDAAVERAYGVDFGRDEDKLIAHLFKLYEAATVDE